MVPCLERSCDEARIPHSGRDDSNEMGEAKSKKQKAEYCRLKMKLGRPVPVKAFTVKRFGAGVTSNTYASCPLVCVKPGRESYTLARVILKKTRRYGLSDGDL